MAARRRSLILLAALGLIFLSLLAAPRAEAQVDPGTGASTSTAATMVPASTEAVGTQGAATEASTTSEADQTLLDAPPPTERRLATESRKVMAIILALVVVALLLLLLTIRYWRTTRPMLPNETVPLADVVTTAPSPEAEPAGVAEPAAPADEAVPVDALRGVDPVPTDEHERVEVPTVTRPSTAVRRAALGIGS